VYIKELQLLGFKSFQEKTTLHFAPGMNCIIGPNGCGKSNVLDALRWVLGEQSFSVLRCAKNEDLIFAGTAQIPPVNFAEVRLVLATGDRPELGSEVEIRRRFFRSGESEYYLNRQPCRLRDIQDLFLSTGIGTKTYSIFDLRQIREIIAGNIRQLFEEAATLTKFREAKEDCQRKLELTRADLTRLEDIIAERERVVRSLQRQTARLRVYQRLKEEENRLRLVELKAAYYHWQEELVATEKVIREQEADEAAKVLQIRQLEAELNKLHSQILEVQGERERALKQLNQYREMLTELTTKDLMEKQELEFLQKKKAELQAEKQQLTKEIAELEKLFANAIAQLEETNETVRLKQKELENVQNATRHQESETVTTQQQAEDKRNELRQAWEKEQQLRSSIIKLEADLANNRATLHRTLEERKRITNQLDQAEIDLKKLAQENNRVKQTIETLRTTITDRQELLAKIDQQLTEVGKKRLALQEVRAEINQEITRLSGRTTADDLTKIRAVLDRKKTKTIRELLKPNPDWEPACAAVLYSLIDFFAPPDINTISWETLFTTLPEKTIGLLLPSPTETDHSPQSVPIGDERLIGSLADFVSFDKSTPVLIQQILHSFQVVKDRAALMSIVNEHPQTRLVTQDGLAYFGDSRLVIAGRDIEKFQWETEITELKQRHQEIEQQLATLPEQETTIKNHRNEIITEIEKWESELKLQERQYFAQEGKFTATVSLVAELKREKERLANENRRLNEIIDHQETELTEKQQQLSRIANEIKRVETELTTIENLAADYEQRVKLELKQAATVLAELTEHRTKVQRLETESEHIKSTLTGKQHRLKEIAQALEELEQRRQEITAAIQNRQTTLTDLRVKLQSAETIFGHYDLQDVVTASTALEKNLAELRQLHKENQENLFQQRLARAEIESKIRALIEEAKSVGASPAVFDTAANVPPPSTDDFQKLQAVRNRLQVLGQVNPLALEEYEQEKRDLERLLFQRDDVLEAQKNLTESLKEIDQYARDHFLATYQEVREHFQAVFKELFLEGEADLLLSNDGDPLEGEITIIAKPRGKNPKRLEQLSDGEKALLAVSLLFAFYRVKPAPFCFLDEIDAPLDDANVSRFADYLKRLTQNTQVIIITHNRTTVERADLIFGVTAEQPGISKIISVSLADYRAKNLEQPPADN